MVFKNFLQIFTKKIFYCRIEAFFVEYSYKIKVIYANTIKSRIGKGKLLEREGRKADRPKAIS